MSDNWEEVVDDEGNVYYHNVDTGETSWTKPGAKPAGSWERFETDDGREYYYNAATEETTWDKPEEFVEAEIERNGSTDQEKVSRRTERDEELEKEPIKVELKIETVENEEEACEAFQKMLADHQVDSTWAFHDVMKKLVTESAYWAVKDPLKRKALYDEFLVDEMKKEMTNRTDARDKFESNFVQVLEGYRAKGILGRNTRWFSIKSRLLNDDNPIFKHSVLSDGEIYYIFKKFQDELKKEYETTISDQKQQALSELYSYLSTVNPSIVEESKNWDSLYERLRSDSRFKANKHFTILHKYDILKLYSDKIFPDILGKINAEIEKEERANYRSDRKARDAFKKLLDQLPIQANTLFKDLFPTLESEDSFIELCGRNGSNSIELFWDVTTKKIQELKVKTDIVQRVLEDIVNAQGVSYDELYEDKTKFFETLSGASDARLEIFNIEKNTEEHAELGIIFDNLKREYELKKHKQRQNVEHSLQNAKGSFAQWLSKNYKNYDKSIRVVETLPDELDAQVLYVRHDPAAAKYSVASFDNTKFDFHKIFADTEEYESIKKLLDTYRDLQGDSAALQIGLWKDIVEEFVVRLGKEYAAKPAKRTYDQADDTPESAKRQKTNGPAKPRVVLNY